MMLIKTGLQNNSVRFNDLKSGDVFTFLKDLGEENFKVYMKCGYERLVNLETGVCFVCSNNDYVKYYDNARLCLTDTQEKYQ